MEVKKDILWRVYLCFLGMILLGAVVLGKAFYIQHVEGKMWKNMGDSMHLKYMPIDAERGTIYSEDGNMLSTSVPVFDVYIDFGADGLREKDGKRFKDNIDSLSICLAGLFNDKSAAAYKQELQMGYENEDRFYTLKKKLSFDQYQQLRSFPLVRSGKNKSGFIIDSRDKRINPYGLLAYRTIGISRDDSTKNVGLEQSYDSVLRGVTGEQLVRYVSGAYMPVEGAALDPENGKDIITTLDTYMQDVTEDALMNMLVSNNSIHGTAIVMETATGKIKAIANLGQQKDHTGAFTRTFTEDLNYGIGMRTEPGSIFKAATLLSLLEDKYVTISTPVDCEGGTKYFYGLKITDSHLGTHVVNVKEAFAMSSNVAFAKLGEAYYGSQPSKFINHLHALHLDTLTGVDITASSGYPIVKKPGSRTWSATTIPFMSHGYEVLETPLNMLMFFNAIANNGRMMKPYLVDAIRENGATIKTFDPQVLVDKICSDETLSQLVLCMRAVVDSAHGTAHKIKDSTYDIAGKTGTAVTANGKYGYEKNNKTYQASFIGFFPADHPQYTIAVVIQNSSESKLIYGADVSGTVFKAISDKIYARFVSVPKYTAPTKTDTTAYTYMGLKSDWNVLFGTMNPSVTDSTVGGTWKNVQVKAHDLVWNSSPDTSTTGLIVPNAIGMGLKDAIYLLENVGLAVTISGRGRVFNQSIHAGTPFKKGDIINLILE
jgi:cell division protein FtsI (penicillin-binding protein 3)